jgi:8-oxo-dGTP diphosphatase
MTDVTRYVVGFLFSPDRRQLVLIKKDHPKWMVGLLNGVGGHMEEGETPEACMRREFREETGLDITNWERYACLSGPTSPDHPEAYFEVNYFRAFDERYHQVSTVTSEPVATYDVLMLFLHPELALANLRWAIPMALGMDRDRAKQFLIEEIH